MKRLIFCFDGTWNNLDSGNVTNVGIVAQSIASHDAKGTAQFIYYDEGVGTARRDANIVVKKIEKWGGGLFGHGLLANLGEAYKFLIFNYEPGDEIYVFGFSRGAFSARSFTGLLHACGILRRSHAERISEAVLNYRTLNAATSEAAKLLFDFRWRYAKDVCLSEEEDAQRCEAFPADYTAGASPLLRIEYLGVWDTVGSLGIPNHWGVSRLFNGRYRFHDSTLSQFVKKARHAVAIDERRKSFAPTLWDNLEAINRARGFKPDDPKAPYQEIWFPGTHGSVGGGGGVRGLSDEALNWVLRGARECGLSLDTADAAEIFDVRPNFRAPLDNVDPDAKPGIVSKLMARLPATDRTPGPKGLYQVSETARYRWAADKESLPEKSLYRPKTLEGVAAKLDDWAQRELAQAAAPAAADNSTPPEARKIHLVKPGETLSKIARAEYGDIRYYKPLFHFNRPPLTNADEIYIGQEIWLPARERLDAFLAG